MGIETYGILTHNIISTFSDQATAYIPTPFTVLPEILNYVHRNDVVVDIGCGKGRVIWFLGSRLRLKKIVGIEIVPELAERARRNLERYRRTLKCPVEIVEGDASKVDLSQGTVFYLNNPFGVEMLAKVLSNIRRSLKKHERNVLIVYKTPAHNLFPSARTSDRFEPLEQSDLLDSSLWLREMSNTKTLRAWINREKF
jgi:SAM-dependent methyltransferase